MSPRIRGTAALAAVLLIAPLPPHPASAATPIDLGSDHALIRFRLPGGAALQQLVAGGADIAGRPKAAADGAILADLVVDQAELTTLTTSGARATQVIERESDGA